MLENNYKTKNILIVGLYNSGASAVLDMFREYNNIGYLPEEFNEFRRPGMIADHIIGRVPHDYPSKLNEIYKKKKYFYKLRSHISYKIIENLKKGLSYLGIRGIKRDLYNKRIRLLKDLEEDFSKTSNQEKKIRLAQNWIQNLVDIFAANKDYMLIDQPILLPEHYEIWPKVYEPFKMLIVYRDPRDLIANMIKKDQLYLQLFSRAIYIYGGGREGAINLELDTLLKKMQIVKKIMNDQGNERVAAFSFDRFIKEHNLLKPRLHKFLSLKVEDHINKNRFFKLNESKKNVDIYSEFLTEKELAKFKDVMVAFNELENNNPFYK